MRAVEVGDDAADRVVRGRRDRDRLERRVVAGALERRHQAREALALDRAQVEAGMPALGDRARDDVARRELVGEAVAAVVEQQRALAAQRLGEQEAVVDERRRMELDELEVGERGARAVGEHEPLADRAERVRRALPERGVAAGREERRRRRDRRRGR